MAEDDLLLAADFAFLWRERAAKHRSDAQQRKPGGRHAHGANLLRRAIQIHGLIAFTKKGLAFKRSHFLEAIKIIAGRAVIGTSDSGLGVIVGHYKDGAGVRDR